MRVGLHVCPHQCSRACVCVFTLVEVSPPHQLPGSSVCRDGEACQVPHCTTLTSHGSQRLSHLHFWIFKKYFPKLYLALGAC